ncbi:hypothetical protein EV356DRAFT_532690 [Viridothelium virens]|uniref:Rhodopsin domain-containing protein n=1 Tax=Viridothelium virens TaxID=1048519 RepID=A0A6A6HAW7_VIRVR|nr:hypothetical protein EV356DRAFT_532690 [Viridothelium virens]
MTSSSPPVDLSQDRGSTIVATQIVFISLAAIAVALRIYSRSLKKAPLGADDYLIIASLPFSAIEAITTCVAVHYGLGKHEEAMPPQNVRPFSVSMLVLECAWGVSVPFVKLSFLMLYVRLFPSRAYKAWAWLLGTYTVLWGVMVVIATTLQCYPVAYQWNKSIKGHCDNRALSFFLSSVLEVPVDFIILILPLPVVWRLKLSRPRKVLLTGIFMLGSLTCVVSVIRLVRVDQTWKGEDTSWELTEACIWSAAEPTLGTVACCLPVMGPILIHFAPRPVVKKISSFGSKPSTAIKKPNKFQRLHNSGSTATDPAEQLVLGDMGNGITKSDARAVSDEDLFRGHEIAVTKQFSVDSENIV